MLNSGKLRDATWLAMLRKDFLWRLLPSSCKSFCKNSKSGLVSVASIFSTCTCSIWAAKSLHWEFLTGLKVKQTSSDWRFSKSSKSLRKKTVSRLIWSCSFLKHVGPSCLESHLVDGPLHQALLEKRPFWIARKQYCQHCLEAKAKTLTGNTVETADKPWTSKVMAYTVKPCKFMTIHPGISSFSNTSAGISQNLACTSTIDHGAWLGVACLVRIRMLGRSGTVSVWGNDVQCPRVVTLHNTEVNYRQHGILRTRQINKRGHLERLGLVHPVCIPCVLDRTRKWNLESLICTIESKSTFIQDSRWFKPWWFMWDTWTYVIHCKL